jgi:hypothetical protein
MLQIIAIYTPGIGRRPASLSVEGGLDVGLNRGLTLRVAKS